MVCRYRQTYGCYSITCCCCLDVDEACSWIGYVGLLWCIVATLVDFISAYVPEQTCHGCLDYALNARLSIASGYINAVQCLTSVLLLIGAKLANRWLLLAWLAWGVVSLVMQGVWLGFTLPYSPSVRAAASLFQLGWGIHFFLVVRIQYKKLALNFTLEEEVLLIVPPNTPVKRHKRRLGRLNSDSQPPIRTLLRAAQILQRALKYTKKVKGWETNDEEEQEEENGEEEEISVTVCHGGLEIGETRSRRRGTHREGTEEEENEGIEWDTDEEEEEEDDEEEAMRVMMCPTGPDSRETSSRRRATLAEGAVGDEREVTDWETHKVELEENDVCVTVCPSGPDSRETSSRRRITQGHNDRDEDDKANEDKNKNEDGEEQCELQGSNSETATVRVLWHASNTSSTE